jgi:hypothetical protein
MTFLHLTRAEYPEGLRLSPWATQQLCQRLGIPIGYFRRCPAALQDANVNHWLEASGQSRRSGERRSRTVAAEKWLLRARGDTLRGVLTERYARLDNVDLLTALAPLWESRFEVGWFALTDETLHLRVIDPRLSREVLPGDRLVAGLHIANSEVGKRSVTVDALVWRLVCQNGLVRLVKGRSLLSQRHVALSRAEFALALRDAIREALISGAGFMERLVWATRQSLRDLDPVLTTLVARWRLSQTTEGLVRKALSCERNGQQETLYGLINGLTNAAQQLGPDARYALETLAGRLLETGVPRGERTALPVGEEAGTPPRSLFAEEEFGRSESSGEPIETARETPQARQARPRLPGLPIEQDEGFW